jgi:uncharacterized Zn-binding protein involved in type VI secretion
MPPAHRHGDPRVCGATTVVVGQSTTYVDGKLWAVKDDINTDGDGQLIPTGSSVFVEGKPVIVHTPDHAQEDDLCIPIGAPHCDPETAAGSGATFAYG